jgi:hypothetical protein
LRHCHQHQQVNSHFLNHSHKLTLKLSILIFKL